jgi:putative membrane protein
LVEKRKYSYYRIHGNNTSQNLNHETNQLHHLIYFVKKKFTMRKLLYIPIIMFAAIFLGFATTQSEIEQEDKKTKEFLVGMTDARLMDREEGKRAAEKGTTETVRLYGEKMIKDQTYLLQQLQAFAKTKHISLPTTISDKKANALKDLKEKSGTELDEKFIKMICIDHTRDVKKLKKALKSEDVTVAQFASKHLPMIQNHLSEIKQIKKNYN